MSKKQEKETENAVAYLVNEDGELLTDNNGQMDMPDPFEEPEHTIFNLVGEPRQWRADMSSNGGYKVGEGRPQDKLHMEILHWEDMPQTQLFKEKYDKKDWGCIYFVDEDNQFSTMLIKGYTRDNFVEMLRSLSSKKAQDGKKLTIGKVVVTASTTPKVGKDKEGKDAPYRVGVFEFKENTQERIKELKEFYIANKGFLYSNFINEQRAKAPILLGVPQEQHLLLESEPEKVA